MSADLVRRWRRMARDHEQAAAAVAIGTLSSNLDTSHLRGYAEALRRCANSLQRSMVIAQRKREAGK